MKPRNLNYLLGAFFVCALTVEAQPVITNQPISQTVYLGSKVTFSVMATGIGPLTYQWQQNGTNLPNNIISTLAGNGSGLANLGDGGLAILAGLSSPQGVTVDASGNIFIADSGNHSIRKVGTNGIITRVAGIGYSDNFYRGSGLVGSVSLNNPAGVVVDAVGNLFIADQLNHRICKVDTAGRFTTVAGPNGFNSNLNPLGGYSGDGGPASSAGLYEPTSLAMDSAGNLFIADSRNYRIRKIDTSGIITTVAGTGIEGYNGDGGAATNAGLEYPLGVAVDSVGNIFITDHVNSLIRKVDTNGIITTVAGYSSLAGYMGDGVAATNTTLYQPKGVTTDMAGNLFIADTLNNRVRKVDTNGIITTVVFGNLRFPTRVSTDTYGNLLIADNGNNRIRKVDTNGIVTTVAGNGIGTYTGDTGSATSARFGLPIGGAADVVGNFFIADRSLQRIRKVDVNGVITTVAGNGSAGFSGDGGLASNARLNNPNSVAVDNAGNLFIADQSNHRVRMVGTNGRISTFAGNGTASYSGDGAAATNATLNSPAGVAVDAIGNLFIADQSNQRIRKVDTNGIITTVAGKGTATYSGDGGLATNASLNNPSGIAFDAFGNLFIADKSNNRIRKVDTNNFITTVAGTNGIGGFSGNGGWAITNRLNSPTGVTVDSEGNLLIADLNNNRVRQVGTNGIITTIAGNGTNSFSGDGGLATNATLSLPSGVAVDVAGNLLITDQNNYRIRKVTFSNKPYLTLFNVNFNNASNYSVIITSTSGSVTSSVASVNFQLPPIASNFSASNGVINFAWATVPNFTYQLQTTTNLIVPVWQDVGAPITATNNQITTTNAADATGQQFYRVRLLP